MRVHRLQGLAAYSHLLETDEALYLVDAGMVGHGRRILRAIREIGRRPEELRLAIVSHGHADHFGGLAEVQDAAGPFDVIAHPSHVKTIATGGLLVSPGLNPFSRLYEHMARNSLESVGLRGVGGVFALDDGSRLDDYGIPGRIVYTPGHSSGDISLLLDDGRAFVGDTVQGRRIPGITPPEFPNMALDIDEVASSWRVLLDSGATTFYPAHGSVVTADELRPVLERRNSRRPRPETGRIAV